MVNERKNQILYPPTIIGHITGDIADLFRYKAKGKNSIKVGYGCQLNGHPHLGTAISLMSSFALAEHLQERLELPSEVVFGALENGPGEKRVIEGVLYQRMLCDTFKEGRSLADIHMDSFSSLLYKLSELSGISHSVEMYKDLQSKPRARETLLELIAREDEFVPLLNPSDNRLRVRFKCPDCSYEEKHSRTLEIVEHKPNEFIKLQSRCFDHGIYQIRLSRDSEDFVDVNTMVRNVMKEAVLSEESKANYIFH